MRKLERDPARNERRSRLSAWRLAFGGEGAQIVELAVSLPLLVVLLVGIFDFGQAFNVKEKLGDASRAAARQAANQGTDDLGLAQPASVKAVVDNVINDLTAANVLPSGNTGTCKATSAALSGAHATNPFIWQYTVSGCPLALVVTIDRAFIMTYTGTNGPVKAVASHVTVQYPYFWHFNSVIKVLVPSTSYQTSTPLIGDAVMQNLD
jgi:Flp pilus assembly protein TadG